MAESIVSWSTPFSDTRMGADDDVDHAAEIWELIQNFHGLSERKEYRKNRNAFLTARDIDGPKTVDKYLEEQYPLDLRLRHIFNYRRSMNPDVIRSFIRRHEPSDEELYSFKNNLHRRIEHMNWLNILTRNATPIEPIPEHLTVDELNEMIIKSINTQTDLLTKVHNDAGTNKRKIGKRKRSKKKRKSKRKRTSRRKRTSKRKRT